MRLKASKAYMVCEFEECPYYTQLNKLLGLESLPHTMKNEAELSYHMWRWPRRFNLPGLDHRYIIVPYCSASSPPSHKSFLQNLTTRRHAVQNIKLV